MPYTLDASATGSPCPKCNHFHSPVTDCLDQEWFWTPEWQAKEREADADLVAGRFEEFDNADDFIAALDEPRPVVRCGLPMYSRTFACFEVLRLILAALGLLALIAALRRGVDVVKSRKGIGY